MRYDAFISYRHSELDMYVAKKVHKGLETFKVPRAVAKKSGKKKINRVFRDQEELPIGSDLGNNIELALGESEFLLVVCSPRLPESYWCLKEIDSFIAMHGRDHVLAILVEGEPEESFPKQLREDEFGNKVEPLAADVRGATKSEIDKKLKTEIMRLAAPLLGCSFDDLRQRHKERRMKKIVALATGVAALAVAFGAYSAYNTALIRQNFREKQVSQSKYLATTALNLLEQGDREDAMLVALEALPGEGNDRPFVAEAQNALAAALGAYSVGEELQRDRLLKHDLPVSDIDYNEEGTKLITRDTGNYVYVWDVTTGEKLAQIAPRLGNMGYVANIKNQFILSNDTIVVVEEEYIRCFDFQGDMLWEKANTAGESDYARSYSYAEMDYATDRILCWNSSEVDVYDGLTGNLLHEFVGMGTDVASLSSVISWEKGSDILAIDYYTMEDKSDEGAVAIFNLATKEVQVLALPFTSTFDLSMVGNDLYVIGQNHVYDVMQLDVTEEDFEGTDAKIVYLEKIDCVTGEFLWEKTFDVPFLNKRTGYTKVKATSYEDAFGTEKEVACVVIDMTAYGIDGEAGEILSTSSMSYNINKILFSKTSTIAFLGQNTGVVYPVDVVSGQMYSSNTIETEGNLNDFLISNGCLAARNYGLTYVTLMKYIQGENCTQIAEYDGYLAGTAHSTDDEYYVIEENAYGRDDASAIYHFYRADDDVETSTFAVPADVYRDYACFVKDHQFLVVSGKGEMWILDPATGETLFYHEPIVIEDSSLSFLGDVTMVDDEHLFYIQSGSYMVMFDLDQLKYSEVIHFDEYMNAVVVGQNGKVAFGIGANSGFGRVDLGSGKWVAFDPEYVVNKSTYCSDQIAVDTDCGRMIAACSDGILRVYDFEEQKTIASFPFSCVNQCGIGFLADGEQVIAQGDDGYFRIYSIPDQKFVHVSNEPYSSISGISYEENGTISLRNGGELVVLEADTYAPLLTLTYGREYLPTKNKILVARTYKIYSFPCKTLEDLKEEAKVKYPNASLTEQERIRYSVD